MGWDQIGSGGGRWLTGGRPQPPPPPPPPPPSPSRVPLLQGQSPQKATVGEPLPGIVASFILPRLMLVFILPIMC